MREQNVNVLGDVGFHAPKEEFRCRTRLRRPFFYRTLNVEGLEIFYREAGRNGGSPTMAYSEMSCVSE